MIYALLGAVIMLIVLVGIGINQPRGVSTKTWCYGYLAIAILFDLLVVVALINQNAPEFDWLAETLLGLSAGAATGLAIHVAHHISEESEHEGDAKEKKTMFGF